MKSKTEGQVGRKGMKIEFWVLGFLGLESQLLTAIVYEYYDNYY